MEENFNLLAQSRANYYTKGAPVQFVQVEMLKGDISGDIAVCLTFKNITDTPVTGLQINFKCKDAQGHAVCESEYYYSDIRVQKGEMFGGDDAVFISSNPISSVEITPVQAFDDAGQAIPLNSFKRIRLNPPKLLPASMALALQARTECESLRYVPQITDNGWFCACGAFHPTEEEADTCSECGVDKAILQKHLTEILQQSKQPEKVDEPTREIPVETRQSEGNDMPTQVMEKLTDKERFEREYASRHSRVQQEPEMEQDEETSSSTRYVEDSEEKLRELQRMAQEDAEEYEYEEEDSKDETARMIIRWAPPITLVICLIIALAGFLIYNILQ